MTAEISQVVH